MGIQASCAACGRTWTVKQAGRRYRCRECGGPVEASARATPASAIDLDAMVACPECSALNPPDAARCVECGRALGESSRAAKPGALDESERERLRERLSAASEMGTLRSDLRALRLLFGLWALPLLALGAMLLFAASAEGDGSRLLLIVGCVYLLLGVTSIVAAVRIFHQPFGWSLGLAILQVAAHLAGRPVDQWLMPSYGLFLAVGQVFITWSAWRVRQLAREHPDLWNALEHHRARDAFRERVGEGGTARQRARRRRRVPGPVLAATVGAIVIGAAGILLWKQQATAPDSVDESRARFEASWNAGDLDRVALEFDAPRRERMLRSTRTLVDRQGWDALPALGARRVEREDETLHVCAYDVGGRTLRAHWSWRETHWVLAGLEFPRD
ncbi:MAG: zinc ribbon domain-containing protein [Planctomycetes bacterium]|nr:zinc ribbon domain-containing protein [Planctomycetota bacterium]